MSTVEIRKSASSTGTKRRSSIPARGFSPAGGDWRSAPGGDGRPAIFWSPGLPPFTSSSPCSPTPDWRSEFLAAVKGVGEDDRAILVAGPSPAEVVRLGEAGVRWSFAFIDGDHDGQAPTNDALASEALSRADGDGAVSRSDFAACGGRLARPRLEGLEDDGLSDRANHGRRLARRHFAGSASARSRARTWQDSRTSRRICASSDGV